MRSHPKKRQLLKPDAAPRGDSLYVNCTQMHDHDYNRGGFVPKKHAKKGFKNLRNFKFTLKMFSSRE